MYQKLFRYLLALTLFAVIGFPTLHAIGQNGKSCHLSYRADKLANTPRMVLDLTHQQIIETRDIKRIQSPDGNSYLVSQVISGKPTLILYRTADKSNKGIILNPPDTEGLFPAWSPDGRQLAFSVFSFQNALLSIYLANADGSNVHQLTDFPSGAAAWSPDGKRIAFPVQTGTSAIAIISPDGSNLRHYKLEGNGPGALLWSPSGEYIAASTNPDAISILNTNTSTVKTIAGGNLYRVSITWSYDGQWLVYSEGGAIEGPTTEASASSIPPIIINFFKVHPDASGITQMVFPISSIAELQWSPDSDLIAFTSGEGQLYVSDASALQTITTSGADHASAIAWECNMRTTSLYITYIF